MLAATSDASAYLRVAQVYLSDGGTTLNVAADSNWGNKINIDLTFRTGYGNVLEVVEETDGDVDPTGVGCHKSGFDSFCLASKVARIAVDAKDGNDTIKIGTYSAIQVPATVYGGTGSDTIIGGAAPPGDYLYGGYPSGDDGKVDHIFGHGGNDKIFGQGGDDELVGGPEDSPFSDQDSDNLYGGPGADTIKGDVAVDNIYGGVGGTSSSRFDDINGGEGNDNIWGGDADGADNEKDEINGDDGNDVIFGEGGDDHVEGDGDNDTLHGGPGTDELVGDIGIDTIWGACGNGCDDDGKTDYIAGGSGNDTIHGQGGDDYIYGDVGVSISDARANVDSPSTGTPGNDTIYGDGGTDRVHAGAGIIDMVKGGSERDYLSGEEGFDMIDGEAGDDYLYGAFSASTSKTEPTGDRLSGGVGNDYLYGNDGDDTLSGGDERDHLYGQGDGDKNLDGDKGDDDIEGGAGADVLRGGPDNDKLLARGGNCKEGPSAGGSAYCTTPESGDQLYCGTGTETNWEADFGDTVAMTGSGSDECEPGEPQIAWRNGTTLTVHGGKISRDSVLKYSSTGDGRVAIRDLNGWAILIAANVGCTRPNDSNYSTIWCDPATELRFQAGPGDDQLEQDPSARVNARFSGSGDDGRDQFDGGPRADDFNGGDENDVIKGFAGNDVLSGGSDDDTIIGGPSGPGQDSLSSSRNYDRMSGGGGAHDTISYKGPDASTGAVTVDLDNPEEQDTGGAGIDDVGSFDRLEGSEYGDTLRGDDGLSDEIDGDMGQDYIDGRGGNDDLDGGDGPVDFLSYDSAQSDTTVDLSDRGPQTTFSSGLDTVDNFEILVGSQFDDTLRGDDGPNIILGGEIGAATTGNDDIEGMGSTDTLLGLDGADWIHASNDPPEPDNISCGEPDQPDTQFDTGPKPENEDWVDLDTDDADQLPQLESFDCENILEPYVPINDPQLEDDDL